MRLKTHGLGCCIDFREDRRVFTRGIDRPLSDTCYRRSPVLFPTREVVQRQRLGVQVSTGTRRMTDSEFGTDV